MIKDAGPRKIIEKVSFAVNKFQVIGDVLVG